MMGCNHSARLEGYPAAPRVFVGNWATNRNRETSIEFAICPKMGGGGANIGQQYYTPYSRNPKKGIFNFGKCLFRAEVFGAVSRECGSGEKVLRTVNRVLYRDCSVATLEPSIPRANM